jgi:2-haloacid dehalogenase
MVGAVHGIAVGSANVEALREGLLTIPAHPDVEDGQRDVRQ